MSSKILLKFLGGCLALFIVMGIAANKAEAQSASGKLDTPASQIISPVLEYDGEIDRHTHITITNTDTDPEALVTVHVQFLIADLGGGTDCNEVDFFDTFTSQDTHTYSMDGACAVNGGLDGSCPISIADRQGLWVITPVVSIADPTAIAYNHLHGVTHVFNNDAFDTVYRFNSVGRTAVNESGGSLADNTPLDGAANALEDIIPDQMIYHYVSLGETFSDLILVAISDNYSGGAAGYKAGFGSAEYEKLRICDEGEVCISCDTQAIHCIDLVGINESVPGIDNESIICNEAGNPDTGLDQLVLNSASANVVFGVLGLTTTDIGGASHLFVK